VDAGHCDEINDTCFACTSDAECSDGLYCNGTETCVNHVCQPGTPPNCNDSNPCTVDSCDESTDSCVNTDATSINVTLDVQGLSPTVSVTRDVRFVITTCPNTQDERIVPVVFNAVGTGSVTLTNVDTNADWIQATEGHTLGQLLPLTWVGGCSATVSFTGADELKSGDFSNPPSVPQDALVDIQDFAILFMKWGQAVDPSEGSLADATGDGMQDATDFTLIQTNFADIGDAESGACPGAPLLPRQVTTRLSVSVGSLGITAAQARLADRNGDGVVDLDDVQIVAQEKGLPLLPSFQQKVRLLKNSGTNPTPSKGVDLLGR
jgi:hypothetical protein